MEIDCLFGWAQKKASLEKCIGPKAKFGPKLQMIESSKV
jgi:hypothetical protein